LHDPDDVDFAEYSDGASVYAVSPAAERLEPGEEMRVDVALMAVPVSVNTSEAAERAQKTYAGDGKNLYLPPPVAMKPRMLWGYYRPLPDDEGVWLDFDVVGQAAIDARDFSYFSGIDASAIGNHELAPGRTAVTLRADVTGELTKGGDTISLKGRLDSGEFFEATLQPYRETLSPAAQAEVETFWSTPGKLARELLRVSPNPFRDATLVGYEVPSSLEREDGSLLQFSGSYETTVKIYNVAGRLINTLVERGLQPGTYSVDWPAVDDNGNRVASGVYYVRLQIERRSVTQRLIFLK
jgi:hypothetical protein